MIVTVNNKLILSIFIVIVVTVILQRVGEVKSLRILCQGNGAAPSCVLFAFLNGVLNP